MVDKTLKRQKWRTITTTFEDLHGLVTLPGFAVQRLMADGYGFGAEGNWKTAALAAEKPSVEIYRRVLEVKPILAGDADHTVVHRLTRGLCRKWPVLSACLSMSIQSLRNSKRSCSRMRSITGFPG